MGHARTDVEAVAGFKRKKKITSEEIITKRYAGEGIETQIAVGRKRETTWKLDSDEREKVQLSLNLDRV